MDSSFTDAVAGVLGTQLRIPKQSALRFINQPANMSSGLSGVRLVNQLVEIRKMKEQQKKEEAEPDTEAVGFPTFANQGKGMMTAPLVNRIAQLAIFGEQQ